MYGTTPVSWSSKRQKLVAPSSTCAEFMALHDAVKEAMWLRKLLVSLKLQNNDDILVPIYTDSANAYSAVMEGTKTNLTR